MFVVFWLIYSSCTIFYIILCQSVTFWLIFCCAILFCNLCHNLYVLISGRFMLFHSIVIKYYFGYNLASLLRFVNSGLFILFYIILYKSVAFSPICFCFVLCLNISYEVAACFLSFYSFPSYVVCVLFFFICFVLFLFYIILYHFIIDYLFFVFVVCC